jgi:hypothetical protein
VAIQLNYSPLDRLLHRVAFAGSNVQLAAANIEKTLFGSTYERVRGSRPVFITSLPRAGTTLMLEALHEFPSLASQTYRDMPFVLAPVIWSRMSGSFRTRATLAERAHGDGVQVGYDSPEAFEEVLWRAFWPEKYTATRIALWRVSDGNPDARAFLIDHMKKVIALRRPDRTEDGRYLSKNNANIARLDFICDMLPDATIVLVVRHPIDHAASLLRQHRGFLELQREQPFVRQYMADIGHYEFGVLHRPIAFPGLEPLIAGRDPLTFDYWLAYWIAAFEHLSTRVDRTVSVSYEAACRDPSRVLAQLCDRLDLHDEGASARAAALFRSERGRGSQPDDADRDLVERAESLHRAVLSSPYALT